MPDDGYKPLIDREREPESRVREDLNRSSRDRIMAILTGLVADDELKYAMKELQKKASTSEIRGDNDDIDLFDVSGEAGQLLSILMRADTEVTLTFVEYTINRAYERLSNANRRNYAFIGYGYDDVQQAVIEIEDVLITEGLLWRLEHENRRYIQFHRIESEAFDDIDTKVRALAQKDSWNEALSGYNDAFERYLNGDYDDVLVKKLYASIEEVLRTICVDMEGWTDDREKSHGSYLELLRESEVYNANDITAPELNELLDSLEKMVSKVGYDRKQRHAYHDRIYCTLLIHQVGAFLYFLISRYEEWAD